MKKAEYEIIAHIKTDFKDKFGLPRQSGKVKELEGTIVFEPKYRSDEALRGLENFSHLWIIFDFSKSHRKDWSATVRPPRLGGNKKVGVFASRSPFRPNPIGMSCVKIESIEDTENLGKVIKVSGIDLLDNTPVIDIKPYIPYADSIPNASGSYAEENLCHKLKVVCEEDIGNCIDSETLDIIKKCIAEDPRPSYQNDDRVYKMKYGMYDVHFVVEEDTAKVIEVKQVQ